MKPSERIKEIAGEELKNLMAELSSAGAEPRANLPMVTAVAASRAIARYLDEQHGDLWLLECTIGAKVGIDAAEHHVRFVVRATSEEDAVGQSAQLTESERFLHGLRGGTTVVKASPLMMGVPLP